MNAVRCPSAMTLPEVEHFNHIYMQALAVAADNHLMHAKPLRGFGWLWLLV
jgi:hypothetical protein